MAKKRPVPAQRPDPSAALADLETPRANWKVIAQIAAVFAVVWLLAFMVKPFLGIWGFVVAGVLTAIGAGFGIYVYRLTRKSSNIVEILKGATDAEGRKAALERLRSEAGPGGKDAMNALAQAQLLAAEQDPDGAIRTLEAIDIDDVPAMMRDDVRSNLALLYLSTNRTKDARTLANAIEPDRQPQAKAKAMYVAVVAEAKARTGAAEEAMTLLDPYKGGDPALTEMEPLLLRAKVYAAFHAKKRNLAKTQIEKLASIDPNMLGPFFVKNANPELAQLAKTVLQQAGVIPRGPKMRMR